MTIATLAVAAIQNGSVIDHIPAGSGVRIIELLQLKEHPNTVTVGLNLPSKSMGKKDLLKIEGRFLTPHEIHEIAIFAPNATINLIHDFKLKDKFSATLPESIRGLLVCPNQNCISRNKDITSLFNIEVQRQVVQLHCHYCEGVFFKEAIVEYTR
jgi:aspartate carbamoyltransferase regulatory subunit